MSLAARSSGGPGLAPAAPGLRARDARGARARGARRRWRWLDRTAAALAAPRLDRVLAAGGEPDWHPLLTRRAQYLVSRHSRRRLAKLLQSRLLEATRPSRPQFGAAVPVRRSELVRATDEVLAVVGRLRGNAPVRPQGAARLYRLLCDGSGPLYCQSPRGTLAQALTAVEETLVIEP